MCVCLDTSPALCRRPEDGLRNKRHRQTAQLDDENDSQDLICCYLIQFRLNLIESKLPTSKAPTTTTIEAETGTIERGKLQTSGQPQLKSAFEGPLGAKRQLGQVSQQLNRLRLLLNQQHPALVGRNAQLPTAECTLSGLE